MTIGIKDKLSGGVEMFTQQAKFLGNPGVLMIAIIILCLFMLAIAITFVEMNGNRWKLLAASVVLLIIIVPSGVLVYEWCRKKSLDSLYMKSQKQFITPPSKFFERPSEPIQPTVFTGAGDSLSEIGDLRDWFAE